MTVCKATNPLFQYLDNAHENLSYSSQQWPVSMKKNIDTIMTGEELENKKQESKGNEFISQNFYLRKVEENKILHKVVLFTKPHKFQPYSFLCSWMLAS